MQSRRKEGKEKEKEEEEEELFLPGDISLGFKMKDPGRTKTISKM